MVIGFTLGIQMLTFELKYKSVKIDCKSQTVSRSGEMNYTSDSARILFLRTFFRVFNLKFKNTFNKMYFNEQ